MATARRVTVIGAGIVGVACASYLQRDGHRVTLIDKGEPGRMTSFGNAGGISPASVVPIGMPGMIKDVPKWLLDPDGPLYVRWSHLPRTLPWLVRFLALATTKRVRKASRALGELNGPTFEAFEPLLKAARAEHLFHRTGQLFVYRTKEGYEKDSLGHELRRATGRRIDVLDRHEIRQLEPALAPIFEKGYFVPDNGHCKDPFALVQALAERFQRDGGEILRREALGFEFGPDGPRRIRTDADELECEQVVIAAGIWSGKLAAELGTRVPLESHRGYHVTIPEPGTMPRLMVFPVDYKFAITPMAMGLRLAGTVELAGIDAPPNYERARVLIRLAKPILPGLKADTFTEWMGHRPCLPDMLPIIGRSPRFANVLFAFGHGHQGLLGASKTGQVIAELVGGRPPSIDLGPFRPERF